MYNQLILAVIQEKPKIPITSKKQMPIYLLSKAKMILFPHLQISHNSHVSRTHADLLADGGAVDLEMPRIHRAALCLISRLPQQQTDTCPAQNTKYIGWARQEYTSVCIFSRFGPV